MYAASRTQHLWAEDFLKNKEKWKVSAWPPGDSILAADTLTHESLELRDGLNWQGLS